MKFLYLACLISALLSCKNRASTELQSDVPKTTQELIQLHRARLAQDLRELQDAKDQTTAKGWIADAIDIKIEMKKNSLYQLERTSARFADPTAAFFPPNPSPLDLIRSPGEGLMESNRRMGDHEENGFFSNLKPSKKTYHLNEFGVSLVFLASIGDPNVPQVNLRDPDRRKIREMFKSIKDRSPPVLSRLVATGEAHLQSTNLAEHRSHIQTVLENLGSKVFADIYIDPTVVPRSWIELMTRQKGVVPDETKIVLQLAEQKMLVSEEDLQLSSQDRANRWASLKDALLAIYHGKEFRSFVQEYSTDKFAEVVARLSLKNLDALPEQVDLSSKFQRPRSQGHSNACVAFAVVADAETFANMELSAGLAYGQYIASSTFWEIPDFFTNATAAIVHFYRERKLDEEHLYAFLDKGARLDKLLAQLQGHPLTTENNFKFSNSSWLPTDVNGIAERNILVDRLFISDAAVSTENLKLLLANDIAPTVLIKYEARTIMEDWIRPEPLSSVGHAINIVGYGTAVDPFDLVGKTYFLVRDSFTNHPVHYRIAADELVPLVQGIAKVLSIRTVPAPVLYPVFNAANYSPQGF